MKYSLGFAVSFAALLHLASPARADVLPPENQPCVGKQVGDACTYNSAAGACQNRTCSRLDYGSWDRDASASPPSVSYTCLQCIVGATTTNTSTVTATPTATATDTTTPTPTATATDTTTATPTATATDTTTPTLTTSATATATNTKDDEPPANDDSACSIGKQITAKRVAPWLLAGAFSLLFLFGRRRRG